jgi:hypothetical protein
LLVEVAGVALGAAEGKGGEYQAQAQAIAELCRLAGADEPPIGQWVEEGRRRAEAARHPPFSRPGRTSRRLEHVCYEPRNVRCIIDAVADEAQRQPVP